MLEKNTSCHRDSRLKVYKWERPAISWHNRRYSHVYFIPICTCREKKNQLYFNLVLIYTDNKVKSKEGKRRNGLRHNFSFYQQYQLVIRPLFLFSRREYTISIHLVDNSWDNTQKKNRSSVLRRGAILDSWW